MSTYTADDRIYWELISPSVQELFKTIQSEFNFFNRRLLDEIARAKAAEDILKDNLDKKIKELFGLDGGEKGQVLRTNRSGLSLYCDDHCFLVQKNLDIDPDFFYNYDFTTGKALDSNNNLIDLPWRSFYYNPKSQKFWWYKFPNDFTEIKVTFSSADEVDDSQGATGVMELLDMGTDFYDGKLRYYKIYTNGWCEQGGSYAHVTKNAEDPTQFVNANSRYVPLKKPYQDAKYIITLSQEFCELPNGYSHNNKAVSILDLYPDKILAVADASNYMPYSSYRTEGFVDLVALGYKS